MEYLVLVVQIMGLSLDCPNLSYGKSQTMAKTESQTNIQENLLVHFFHHNLVSLE